MVGILVHGNNHFILSGPLPRTARGSDCTILDTRLVNNWFVNKAKVGPKTVQGILRHSKVQTTLDLYTQEDSNEARGAQGAFLKAVGIHAGMVQ